MTPELYLDANATSPVLPAALAAAVETMEARFGNPSSSHATGLRAKRILDDTRALARRVLGAGAGRVLFTSGATEGIQTAVLSALCAVRARRAAGEATGDLLLYGATEHKAVSESLAHWNTLLGTGLVLQALPVDADGRHRLDVLRALAPRAAMVCTMAANNESGAISDLDGIAAVLQDAAPRAYWMVDCVQALGKLALGLAGTRIDYAPFSGHKLYAPKGIGMLYVREGAPYTPLMIGGGQEAGLRSGTENMAGIAALGAVLAALEGGHTFRTHDELAAMRERLAAALRDAFPGIVFNAPFAHALPTTLNFAVPDMASKDLLDLFDAAGMRVSAGSACSAAKAAPSYVLAAMGLPAWRSSGAVRLSFGPLADDAFIDAACARIRRCGEALRATALEAPGPAAGVLQLSHEGRHGWIVFDGAARQAVVIDPPAALATRTAALLRARALDVVAVLGTDDGADGARARGLLRAALGLEAREPGVFGWPQGGAEVVLEDGSRVPALAIGADVLARAGTACLLGSAAGGVLRAAAVRLAFVGVDGAAGDNVHPGTLLCRAQDAGGVPFGAASGAVAGAPGQLRPEALAPFLDSGEEAVLVDVREVEETAVCTAALPGRAPGLVRRIPMSRLAEHAAGLLADPRPLVFVCRSGNRSARAALCLHRMGHPRALTVVGGLALAGDR
ncbi:aminotransferase class V-fold PLP-dependent enzyme [uncultured Massilia sp.]|uniref:aminotransferase class V-fold PLP-dependent enzyme n=1 Tax=uncultured Massilia sp. TaxID=169973 RepID=UPI0025EE49E2|nr:aminotransferase class V-fold PLP-dependent enzyme [uncultured Massilia sp.]